MFNDLVKRILEGYNVYPRSKPPMKSGPNAISPGPVPTGFLGGGLPGINPGGAIEMLIKVPKKKKKKITKKKNRL
jgi:hypothetical protein